ncbi:MAG: cation transporting ATPase C-terminal domain-containing protein, partial [Actinobacteria bacterium]|nr:cation transporting ATPase C-terminal domain-containing protein [Actinomycetota bacterium]
LALFYIPPLQKIFGTKPISGLTWLFLFIWPVVILFAEEARKAIVRSISARKKHRSEPAEQTGVGMAA